MANRWGNGRGGRPWRRLVEAVKLRDQYTCQVCKRVTDQGECDHIIPQAKGGKDDISNLQWLCGPCHEAKTIREVGATPKQPIGLDGWPVSSNENANDYRRGTSGTKMNNVNVSRHKAEHH